MILTVAVIAPIAAFLILAGVTLHVENRRDDRKDGMIPGPARPVMARVTRAPRHVFSLACRLPGATGIPGLRAQLIARGAFPSPPAVDADAGTWAAPAAPAAAGDIPGPEPAAPWRGRRADHQEAGGNWAGDPRNVPGRDSPGTSPDVTGENAPAAPHSAADAAAPAGDLSHAIANGGELVTHPDPALWEGHRNIAPWPDAPSPWADEPGTFTAFVTGTGEVA